MKKLASTLLALGFLACVPSKKVDDPHGGVRLQLVPSAATNGQPFVTSDGWTVTFDAVYVRYAAAAIVVGEGTGGSEAERIVNPRITCDVDATAISARRANVTVALSSPNPAYVDLVKENPCGVPADVVPRFIAYADNDKPDPNDEFSYGYTPAVIVTGHGDSNGKSVRFDFALSIGGQSETAYALDPCNIDPNSEECADEYSSSSYEAQSQEGPSTVTIPTNAAIVVRYALHVESLLLPVGGGDPQFGWIAAMDSDGDGRTTLDELKSLSLKCESYDDGSDVLDENAQPVCATGADLLTKNVKVIVDKSPIK